MSRRSIDLGKIMVTLAEGVWNARTSYEVLTAVYHDGDGYISRRDNIGIEPGTDDSVWYRIVKQGTIPNITFDEDGNMYADDVLVTTVFADVIERSREAVENVEQWSQVGDTMVEEEMRRRHQEDERIAAENERVLNERNRRTAEENRARNEASRESNESSREIAEVQREVRFEEAMRQAASTMRKGDPGKSAYEVAVDNGFEGTEVEWLASLTGSAGDSAYAIAVQQGFVGTKDQWLASLVGPRGKSAYQVAVDNGFEGTISEWLLSLRGGQGDPGRGITSVVQTTSSSESEGDNVITVTLSDGTTATFTVKNGKRGLQGIPGVANAKYKQVAALPTASAATMDFIYLVESATAGVYNMSYTEEDAGAYSWKSLGTTAIQMDGYATEDEFNQLSQEVDGMARDNQDADFSISDETGMAIAQFKDGHINTKYFDSKTVVRTATGNIEEADLEVRDEDENVLARFHDGHIQTKYFDSKYIGPVIGRYAGKRISILGDSISTFGDPSATNEDGTYCYSYYPAASCRYSEDGVDSIQFDVENTYWMKLIRATGMKLGVNDSYRGTKVSGTTNAFNLQTRINHLGEKGTPNVILVFGGTNDAGNGVTIGTFNTENPQNYTDAQIAALPVTTFADAYRAMLIRLMKKYPLAEIVVVLPTFTTSYYTITDLDLYVEVIKEACDFFGIKYIDARCTGINVYNRDSFLVDGIHPNAAGMDLLFQKIYKQLIFN